MSWRFKIRHVSGYRYQSAVSSSYNEARITPPTTDSQLVVESRIDIEPRCRPYRYRDYWGTLVHAFDLHQPHSELVVTGTSVVETIERPSRSAPPSAVLGWEELRIHAEDQTELLLPTRYVPLTDEVAAAVADIGPQPDPACAARSAVDWVRSAMSYEPGSTGVSTSAAEALAVRRGVCQDFVHVFLAIARSLGIPARYVSGYLHPVRRPDVGTAVRGESHAWAEVWLGGWVPVDPTNGETPGPRHVLVAKGRDYRDVTPLRGIYNGGAAHALDVDVELTRLA